MVASRIPSSHAMRGCGFFVLFVFGISVTRGARRCTTACQTALPGHQDRAQSLWKVTPPTPHRGKWPEEARWVASAEDGAVAEGLGQCVKPKTRRRGTRRARRPGRPLFRSCCDPVPFTAQPWVVALGGLVWRKAKLSLPFWWFSLPALPPPSDLGHLQQ